MFNTMVVGDLFEETDDWVNDEEAQTFTQIEDLIRQFIIKNNKLYLNVTDLSQIGSIDDIIVGDNERPKLKWDDLSWDKT